MKLRISSDEIWNENERKVKDRFERISRLCEIAAITATGTGVLIGTTYSVIERSTLPFLYGFTYGLGTAIAPLIVDIPVELRLCKLYHDKIDKMRKEK